jgi:hypothetical protein
VELDQVEHGEPLDVRMPVGLVEQQIDVKGLVVLVDRQSKKVYVPGQRVGVDPANVDARNQYHLGGTGKDESEGEPDVPCLMENVIGGGVNNY